MIHRTDIDAVILDAGNTLVSIDFDRVARALASRGQAEEAFRLHRAEAAARPAVSRWLAAQGSTRADDAFELYLEAIFSQVPALAATASWWAQTLAPEVLPAGRSASLWRWVLPGVREGLARLHALGIPLAVVSNSDGTVARVLRELDLDRNLRAIVDSAVLGIEKPDPGIFLPALQACGATPERAIYVGDLYYPDVEGARAARMRPVLIDPFGDWPDVDCESVRDLLHLASWLEASPRAPGI